MLSPTEEVLLKELLAIAPLPEGTLTYHELMGFMFGLAITPIHIDRDEWLDAVFGEEPCNGCKPKRHRPLTDCFIQIYSAFLARQEQGQLQFPYQVETLKEADVRDVREWASGLEEALSLRPDIWAPDEAGGNFANFTDQELEELFFCIMVIQGLADPVEVQMFLERIPDEIFADIFAAYDLKSEKKDRNFQALLLGAFPLVIQALQNFSWKMRSFIPKQAQPTSSSVLDYASLEELPRQGSSLSKTPLQKSNVIQVDFGKRTLATRSSVSAGPCHDHAPYYQLKISINDAKPPIWRRVVVPGSITLAQLHLVIQISMGWLNSHLHQFRIDGIDYGPDSESAFSPDQLDESACSLHSATATVSKFEYTYDFGDYWQHTIQVEKRIRPAGQEETLTGPRVIKGKRACPPENIGGIWGYEEFLEAYTDAGHDAHATMVAWAGPDFRPERFGAKEIEEKNRILSSMRFS